MSNRLFVGNLSFQTTEEDLQQAFREFGEVSEVRIILDADRLTVRDTGRGIPREALDKVFQRLYKGRDSQGAGIGLSLVKKICDRHGWQIVLESEDGKGTTANLVFSGT